MGIKLGVKISLVAIASGGAVLFHYWRQMTHLPDWYQAKVSAPAAEFPPNRVGANTPDSLIQETPPGFVQVEQQEIPATTPDAISTPAVSNPYINSIREGLDQIEQEVPTPRSTPLPQVPAKSDLSLPNPLGSTNLGENTRVTVRLTAEDLSRLAVSQLAARPNGQGILQAVMGLETMVQPESIETGAVIDLSRIDFQELGEGEQELLGQVIEAFPVLRDREVYLGIVGTPTAQGGKLQFGNSTQVKIGNLKLSLAELGQHLGVAPMTLAQGLGLDLGPLRIQTIQLGDGEVIIQGTSRS